MGRSVLGLALATVCTVGAPFFVATPARAQVPEPARPAPAESPPHASAPPPPALQPPAPASAPPVAPAPAATPPASIAPPAAEPALDLPPQEAKRPAFLHTREEMEKIDPKLSARSHSHEESGAEPPVKPKASARDFVESSSPWVDFSLTSFYIEDRVSNFLNFGVQVGGYVFDRLRVSARMVTPIEAVSDDYSQFSSFDETGSTSVRRSRSVSLLYGASIGVVLGNSKGFVFGPSVALFRTDVEDYGTAVELALPFEWTTKRNLRVGFELGLGHAVGGQVHHECTRSVSGIATSCGSSSSPRPNGTMVLFQYYMGWSLGTL